MTTMLAGDDAFASSGSATTAAPLNDRSPPPLFLRFDCAHEMPPAVTANAAIASANAAPAVTEARKGRADDDDAVSRPPSSSFSPGVGAEVDGDRSTRGGRRNISVVDTHHSLSLALKAFPPEEVVPWWVDELVDEGREQPPPPPSSSGSFSRGGESRRTPQSHLLVFATTCPTKAGPRDFLGVADSRRVSTASGGGGGSGAGLIGLESVWTPSVPASGAHLSQV